MKKIIPDTSIVINRKLSGLIKSGELKDAEIIISEFVMDELRSQASRSREIGFEGLEEIKELRSLAEKAGVKLTIGGGRKPTMDEIRLAKKGRLDALIMEIAKDEKGVLYTADYVQGLAAEAEGVDVVYIKSERPTGRISIEDFFDEHTQSVHLKAGVAPYAKKGSPGDVKLVKIRDEILDQKTIEGISREILDKTRISEDSFVEMGLRGATVVQLGNYRISITRPPFSDGFEITAVRPIAKLCIDDYSLSGKLKKRLDEKAEGVLICGPPGSGKSTFVGSLAEFYLRKGKIVKTMEQPRDLQVPKEITQYGTLEGSFEKTTDILLLVRPDYVIYDEMRQTKDFEIFSDMRLSGIGMVGVVHAAAPVDAIHRFMNRVDIGLIPSIVDTTIFIKGGRVEKVYSIRMTVRVPSGMTEADLARPIIEIIDFETDRCEYEIYSYGNQNVVVPFREGKKKHSGTEELASQAILAEMMKFDPNAEVRPVSEGRFQVKVSDRAMPMIIGREGKHIARIEEKLGVSLDIEPISDRKRKKKRRKG